MRDSPLPQTEEQRIEQDRTTGKGSSLSPVLMKEDIHQLDCEVKTAYGSHVRYAQYADDFLFAIKQACLSRKNDGSLENGNS
jgi:hypothetical protein